MKNQKHIMVYDDRFLASLEMTAKQKEKKKAFSGGEAAAKSYRLSQAARVIPNEVRNLLKQLQANDFLFLNECTNTFMPFSLPPLYNLLIIRLLPPPDNSLIYNQLHKSLEIPRYTRNDLFLTFDESSVRSGYAITNTEQLHRYHSSFQLKHSEMRYLIYKHQT